MRWLGLHPRPLLGVAQQGPDLREENVRERLGTLERIDPVEPGDDAAGLVHTCDRSLARATRLCRTCRETQPVAARAA